MDYNKKSNSERRVSFATEPQINYICHEDYSTSNTSSLNNTPMDITCHSKDLNSHFLFACKEDDKISKITKNIEDFDGSFNKREMVLHESFSRRCSLDPLKIIIENDALLGGEIGMNKIKLGETSTKDIVIEKEPENITNQKRISLDPEYNDTAIINSSFEVEELVNTVDLRKLIPLVSKPKINIGEFLSQQGIRFLDESVIDGMKRDTLSKSRNIVDPALKIYFRYSLKERIDFLYNFSGYLIEKMRNLQQDIDEAESKIDLESINKENLKRIRNESRNKSKIDWYGLRKIYEIQFNKRMLENKARVVEMLKLLKKENKFLNETILDKSTRISALNDEISNIKERITRNDKDKIQETEELKKMIDDRKQVLENAKEEHQSAMKAHENYVKENSIIDKKLDRLKYEIELLKKNLAIKNVTETQLNNIKLQIKRYRTIYGINMLKLSKYDATFDLYGNSLYFEFNESCDDFPNVSKFSIVLKESDSFYELAKTSSDLKNIRFKEIIELFLNRFSIAFSIRKEVRMIKDMIKTEFFYHKDLLYLRFFLDSNKNALDLTINNDFNLIENNETLFNLKKSPGSLFSYVSGKIKNK